MVKVDRISVTTTIVVLLKQAVCLSNHMKEEQEPKSGYVREKLNSIPGLDRSNRVVFDRLFDILVEQYGLMPEEIDFTRELVTEAF